MTKKQRKNKQIKYGAIQKECHLHNGIFQPFQLFVTVCQFYFNTFAVLFIKLQ